MSKAKFVFDMNSSDVIIYTTIHIGWCWDISYEILRCPSYLIILGLAVLVKVAVEICGVKTIQREDCKNWWNVKDRGDFIRYTTIQALAMQILAKLEIFSKWKQR